jgi:acetylserotonin N-methyltransferase
LFRDLTIPPPDIVIDLMEGFRRSKAMFAAVSLGIFDQLDKEPNADMKHGLSLKELAVATGCNPESLEILLNSCVSMGLLGLKDSYYENSAVAKTYLCQSSPRRLTGYINYSNEVAWGLWANLEDAVREGTHRWKQTFGTEGPIFSSFFKTPEAMHEFLMGMNGFGMITSPVVVQAFDLSRFKHLVDLGGATGHLSIAACERYPALRATVLDLPHALDLANQMVSNSSSRERLSTIGADFFSEPLPKADLYALGRILHDWDLSKIKQLLKKIFEALPVGGALLIAEKILWEDRTGPRGALLQSLNMLVCTEGKERSFGEYASVLSEAGFAQVECVRTQTPIDAILATKI